MDLNDVINTKASNNDKNKDDVMTLSNTGGDSDEDLLPTNKATAEDRAANVKQHRALTLKRMNLESEARVQFDYWKLGQLKCESKAIREAHYGPNDSDKNTGRIHGFRAFDGVHNFDDSKIITKLLSKTIPEAWTDWGEKMVEYNNEVIYIIYFTELQRCCSTTTKKILMMTMSNSLCTLWRQDQKNSKSK